MALLILLLIASWIGAIVTKPLATVEEDEARAGIEDLNPLKPLLENNKESAQNNNGILPNTNFLKDSKIFLVTIQGMVMPGDKAANGVMSFFQNIGSNMGGLYQGLSNAIPRPQG